MVKEEKPVIFQGTGYRVLRYNQLNVSLEVADRKNDYSFKGFYGTIDQALVSLVRNNYLLDETETFEISNFLSSVDQMKMTIISDIKNLLETGDPEEVGEEDLDEYDLLG
ncbi:hypothetical protein [Enterococcus sp. 5H]|uniref:hypothetical protein n=1 Tax=Enterococcus sp. 5H TaxID=1229490 RepID=UPI002302029C|nr:hypothetical protein [Enterococcus sp. 5H]MDA9472666.1 hypothetical protein [Enterococcus sp. 5H]